MEEKAKGYMLSVPLGALVDLVEKSVKAEQREEAYRALWLDAIKHGDDAEGADDDEGEGE